MSRTAAAFDTASRLTPEQLGPGDAVELRRTGQVLYRGVVEAADPGFGILWVRDAATGARAMYFDANYELFAA